MKVEGAPAQRELSMTRVLFALSDPIRLALTRELLAGPTTVTACAAFAPNMPKATKSHHVKVLREAGVIQSEARGSGRVLSIRYEDLETSFPGLVRAVIRGVGDGT